MGYSYVVKVKADRENVFDLAVIANEVLFGRTLSFDEGMMLVANRRMAEQCGPQLQPRVIVASRPNIYLVRFSCEGP